MQCFSFWESIFKERCISLHFVYFLYTAIAPSHDVDNGRISAGVVITIVIAHTLKNVPDTVLSTVYTLILPNCKRTL